MTVWEGTAVRRETGKVLFHDISSQSTSPSHVQRVEILCIKIDIFNISLQIVMSWECTGIFQDAVKVSVCTEDRNFYEMEQGAQET